MQPMLNIALRAARSASELIFRSIERLDTIKVDEKDAKDYVSESIAPLNRKSSMPCARLTRITRFRVKKPACTLAPASKAKSTCGSSIRWTAPPTSSVAFRTLQ